MQIQSVTIIGMHHVANKTYQFNPINYLHGPNGAGKSTVLNAIQLAILGYIPGTAKQSSAIFQHASQPEMEIQVMFDDGRYIKRRWTTKGKSIITTVTGSFDEDSIRDVIGDLELPIFNFNELVNMTANKLKDWFINFLPEVSGSINWQEELEGCLNGIEIMDSTILEDALKELQNDDGRSTLEKIQAFNALMKSNQSFLKSEMQRAESTVQSLIYYDEAGLQGDATYLNTEIDNAQKRIRELTAQKESMIQAQQVVSSNSRIHTQIAALKSATNVDVETLKSKQDNISSSIADLESSIQDEEKVLLDKVRTQSDISAEIKNKSQIINSNSICPYTKTKCDSIAAMVEQFKQDVATLQASNNAIAIEIRDLQTGINTKKQCIQELRNQARDIIREVEAAGNAVASITYLESMIQPEPDMSQFGDLNFYNSEIDKLNLQISKIRANLQYNSLIDTLTADKYQIENTSEVYKYWAKLTDPNGLQTRLMDAPFKDLAEDMNKYLGIMFSGDVKCNFNLEQKMNSFSFGILRNGRYIPYDLLSSGEKTMYALALMLCIVNKSDSPLKVLIVDDMLDHLDDTRADEVFKSLGQVEGIQVIVAGVKDSVNAAEYTVEINN